MNLIPNHRLPKTTDNEVAIFHPYFQDAADQALISLGLKDEYSVVHHHPTSSGIVDFVILRNDSKKVFLTIEVKRTTMSTRSSGRRQARDYYNNLGATMATKYYCSTNLELLELFKDDNSRKETHTQQVLVDEGNVGFFNENTNEEFFNKLVSILKSVILIVINNEGVYLDKLTNIRNELKNRVDNISDWHQFFIPTIFEYILGMANNSNYLRNAIKSLGWPRTVERYKSTPEKIISKGSALDFHQIFSKPAPKSNDPLCFSSNVLNEAFEAGKASSLGEDIAELVNSILKPKGKGIVETDVELARLLSIIARDALTYHIREDELIWDPCAGSGRLLTSLEPGFVQVAPTQIWANEVKERFKQPLSLRLGMSFINSISKNNIPKVTINNITEIEKADCQRVRLVLINPPYISGIESVSKREKFAERINFLSSKKSKTNKGQIGLEAVFLELVVNLVETDTVVACILPFQHLTRLSKEIASFRTFLVDDFGLSHIVTYPMEGLFSGVMKETVIIVGSKGNSENNIKLVSIESPVSNIDLHQLNVNLQNLSHNPMRGVHSTSFKRDVFKLQAKVGWRRLLGSGGGASKFIANNFGSFTRLIDFKENAMSKEKIYRRGGAGNAGASDLVLIKPNCTIMKPVLDLIPDSWQKKGIKNSENVPNICYSYTLPEVAIYPPVTAYEVLHSDHTILNNILTKYIEVSGNNKKNTGKQKKAVKSTLDLINLIKSSQKFSGQKEVLIPRATRRFARVCLLEDPEAIISTNFLKVKIKDKMTRTLLASWMLSIFGQLQIEFLANPQEGMRKLEIGTLNNFLIPNFDMLNRPKHITLMNLFENEKPLDFIAPVERDTDILWAQILQPLNYRSLLDEAFSLFNQLIEERAP